MKLRNLKIDDADRMLEWMHDPFVVQKMNADFARKEINDCYDFINNSIDETNKNFAVTNDDDIYMGTVSLKHIENNEAEFAIIMHREAIGKGYSSWGMKEIIKKGFECYNLNRIYWCVKKDNTRAIRFYEKNNYNRVDAQLISNNYYSSNDKKSYIWYQILKKDICND